MIALNQAPTLAALQPRLDQFFSLAQNKVRGLAERWDMTVGAPVLTTQGRYTRHNWADWTLGFHLGNALLVYDATGDSWLLNWARRAAPTHMPPHLTNAGGHDHGFVNVSSFGNLLRLAGEGRYAASDYELDYYRLALRVSGAVQAARWTPLPGEAGGGFIHSLHGPHSLFVDSIRSLRALALAHQLAQVLIGESDHRIGLLDRLVHHALVTARCAVYYGEGRDVYDVRGRVAHECIFNVTDGSFRCTTTQQGYSPRSTWMRGLAWAILGFAEQLEYLRSRPDAELDPLGGRVGIEATWRRAAEASADFYLEAACTDGIPYWDSAAPGLARLNGYAGRASDPYNGIEPVDSSAAAPAAQGLWRLGRYLASEASPSDGGNRYGQAALAIAQSLFSPPYVSEDPRHEGLILHAVYNRPGGWDYAASGGIPCGESVMWGDYHALELALLLRREARGGAYLQFFS